jgi:hypothetical protein
MTRKVTDLPACIPNTKAAPTWCLRRETGGAPPPLHSYLPSSDYLSIARILINLRIVHNCAPLLGIPLRALQNLQYLQNGYPFPACFRLPSFCSARHVSQVCTLYVHHSPNTVRKIQKQNPRSGDSLLSRYDANLHDAIAM